MRINLGSRFLVKSHDGGKDSGVTGYWLIEWKRGFSIVLLRFSQGSREAYHSHAFNALTWWLRGEVKEEIIVNDQVVTKHWLPGRMKLTPRNMMHRIMGIAKASWCLSIRGPWIDTWLERKHGKEYTLKHGREVVSVR